MGFFDPSGVTPRTQEASAQCRGLEYALKIGSTPRGCCLAPILSVVPAIVTPVATATHAMRYHGGRADHSCRTRDRCADHAPPSCASWT
jgi:hypothetical protein